MSTTSIRPIDFANRRKRFSKAIQGGVALFASAPETVRNGSVHHEFRQESNFYYLSGFDEPNSLLLFAPHLDKPFQMFVQPKNREREMWEGRIYGLDMAQKTFGADAAYSIFEEKKFEEIFCDAMADAEQIYFQLGLNPQWDSRLIGLLHKAKDRVGRSKQVGRTGRPLWPINDPSEILADMRLIKSKDEADRMRAAAAISAQAHRAAMEFSQPGMHEYEVEAILYHEFRCGGAKRLGYPSIVASGSNACTLHYTQNERKMGNNDLLLIDAGAEYEYYSADITRTFPVSGAFTTPQREIYDAVLKAQEACIKMTRPGKHLREIHHHAVEVLVEEMRRLKILKGTKKQLIKDRAYFPFFPHNTGHWLGLDVHDVGTYYSGGESPAKYDRFRKLEPGMAFTIEPGLYFSHPKSPARYRGIGVRIEDDILVTKNGCEVLSKGAPKEAEEVEALCQGERD